MEFADLIKIPKCDRVILHRTVQPNIHGTLHVTGHHLIISSKDEPREELWLLHSCVDQVENKQLGMTGGTIWLKCKDFQILRIDIIGADPYAKLLETLNNLIKVEEPTLLYPFFYQAMYIILENGWSAFSPESEYSRLIQQTDDWRISYANKNYKLCPSYPSVLVVPKAIDDNELVAISNFRYGGRFPVLAYRHEGKAALLRSSQPLITQNSKRCKEDEKLLSCVLGREKRAYIIDTRTQNLAQSAKLRGGNLEGELHYPNWKRLHKPIDRRHTLLDSLSKLMDAVNETGAGTDKWLSKLDGSGWMNNIKETLNCACLVAQCLDQEGVPVLVHDVDGVDASIEVTSLAQIILNPDCRTVRGLEALIEREWLLGGYPFSTRHSKSCYSNASSRSGKMHAPSFLLFLDCIHQIHSQFVCSFEFTQSLLVCLFEHSYFSQYGTFLGDNDYDRQQINVQTKTTSLWSYINRPDVLHSFLNPMYEPNQRVIWPTVAPMSLQVWDSVFLRWIIDQSPKKIGAKVIRDLREKDCELRSEAIKLRRHLQELEKEAIDLGVLAPEIHDNLDAE